MNSMTDVRCGVLRLAYNLENEYAMQLSLFEEDKWRKRQLGEAMDGLRRKYGTAVHRSKLIGGHYK